MPTVSGDGLEAVFGDEREEFEGGALRAFFSALPLAYQAGGHVEVAGEDGLAGTFAQAEGSDLFRLQGTDRREGRVRRIRAWCACP